MERLGETAREAPGPELDATVILIKSVFMRLLRIELAFLWCGISRIVPACEQKPRQPAACNLSRLPTCVAGTLVTSSTGSINLRAGSMPLSATAL